jgi:hypothetical protein
MMIKPVDFSRLEMVLKKGFEPSNRWATGSIRIRLALDVRLKERWHIVASSFSS